MCYNIVKPADAVNHLNYLRETARDEWQQSAICLSLSHKTEYVVLIWVNVNDMW